MSANIEGDGERYVLVIEGDGRLSFTFYHEQHKALVMRFRDFLVKHLVPQGFKVTLCLVDTGEDV